MFGLNHAESMALDSAPMCYHLLPDFTSVGSRIVNAIRGSTIDISTAASLQCYFFIQRFVQLIEGRLMYACLNYPLGIP